MPAACFACAFSRHDAGMVPLIQGIFLPAYKQPTFADRRSHAETAKSALIERYRGRPGPDDPRMVALADRRRSVHEERLARQADRQRMAEEERARVAAALRLAEEQELAAALAQQAEVQAQVEAAQQARRDRLAASAMTTADQKASRDARYAARKSRQKR